MTVLKPTELLTFIKIPNKWSKAEFYFEKVADRNTWDFALVNVACSKIFQDNKLQDIRIVTGGVECVPKRLRASEEIALGSTADEETAKLAGGIASRGATPLNYNHFKIPLMENLVKRAIERTI